MWAAVAKLRDPAATRRSFDELGLRAPGVAAIVVPVVELLVAVALVLWPPVGGAAAIVLLVAFTVVLVRVVMSGARVPCACFGATATSPVGWPDVARNLGLLALAVAAWVPETAGVPSLGALVLIGLVMLVGRSVLRLARRMDEPG